MKLLLALAAGAAAKQLVPGAHPHLHEVFRATGALTHGDLDAASKMPWKRAAPRAAPSRLGGLDTSNTADECAQYSSTTQCFAGGSAGDDDVWNGVSDPGACAMCGFVDFGAGETSDFKDCAICAGDATLVVLFDDCTGLCATDTGAETHWAGLGFGSLESSSCVPHANCYPEGHFANVSQLGSNTMFVDDGSSYSYSYQSPSGTMWACDGADVVYRTECDCSDCGSCARTHDVAATDVLSQYADGSCSMGVNFACDSHGARGSGVPRRGEEASLSLSIRGSVRVGSR